MRDLPYVVVTLEWAKDELEYEWNLGFWQRLPGDECVGKLWALRVMPELGLDNMLLLFICRTALQIR